HVTGVQTCALPIYKPGVHEKDGVLYVNPGSAGPRRFTLPVALAMLEIAANRLDARIVELQVGDAVRRWRQTSTGAPPPMLPPTSPGSKNSVCTSRRFGSTTRNSP